MRTPVISLLTDFGTADHYVGQMKGVILDICKRAQLVDISHEVSPYGIAEAGYTLAQAWRYFPVGTVHLVVVDPGVGSARRPILAELGGHRFVAPDNGVLTMALAASDWGQGRSPNPGDNGIALFPQAGQPDISWPGHLRSGCGAFSGGGGSGKFGKLISDWVRLDGARSVSGSGPEGLGDVLKGEVLKIDRFGNAVTNLDWAVWEARGPFEAVVGGRTVSRLATSYAEVADGVFLIRGSGGYLEISLNQRSAAKFLGVGAGTPIQFRPLPSMGSGTSSGRKNP